MKDKIKYFNTKYILDLLIFLDLLKKKYSQTKKKFYSKFKRNIKKVLSPQRNFLKKKKKMLDPLCFTHIRTIFIINFHYNQNFLFFKI